MALYGMTGSTGAPTAQEASGNFEPITITIDTTAVLVGVTAGELPAGTLLALDTGTGNYIVADTAAFGVTQDEREIVLLPTDLQGLTDGDKTVAAMLRGIWTDRAYLNNGPLTAAQQDLFGQRLVLRWDGQ